MATYEDLSQYEYWTDGGSAGGSMADRNVGWLGRSSTFETGPVDPAFREALEMCAALSVNQTRGLHFCELCPRPDSPAGWDEVAAGSAEIHVLGADGIVYGAPTLITHYIDAHQYRPPQVFVDAVRGVASQVERPAELEERPRENPPEAPA